MPLKTKFLKANNSGMSLVSLLVAVVVTTIGFMAINNLASNYVRTDLHMKAKMSRQQIKAYLLQTLQCEKVTMPCAPNSFVEIKGQNDRVILPKNGRRIDKHWVYARCSAEGDGLLFQAAMLKDGRSVTSGNTDDYLPYLIGNAGKGGTKRFYITFKNERSLLFGRNVKLCAMKSEEKQVAIAKIIGNKATNHWSEPRTAEKWDKGRFDFVDQDEFGNTANTQNATIRAKCDGNYIFRYLATFCQNYDFSNVFVTTGYRINGGSPVPLEFYNYNGWETNGPCTSLVTSFPMTLKKGDTIQGLTYSEGSYITNYYHNMTLIGAPCQ